MSVSITYGLQGDRLVNIHQVPRGLACACTCVSCGHPLVAKRGQRKKAHFAHHQSSDCLGALESMLHRLAKQWLAEAQYVQTPAVHLYRSPTPFICGNRYHFTHAATEVYEHNIRSDIKLWRGNFRLYIEIAVSHTVHPAKARQFVYHRMPALEINMLAIYQELAALGIADQEQVFKNRLLEDDRHRHWLFHPTKHGKEYALRQAAVEKKVYHSRFKGYHYYRVRGCPRQLRRFRFGPYRGQSYADIWQDCLHCQHCLEIIYQREQVAYRQIVGLPKKVICGA